MNDNDTTEKMSYPEFSEVASEWDSWASNLIDYVKEGWLL